jgi:hypothetical protein
MFYLFIYNGFKFWFVSVWRTTISSMGLICVDMSGKEWSKLTHEVESCLEGEG